MAREVFTVGHSTRTLDELAAQGIDYVWLGEALGGRRSEVRPADRSPNLAWKVAGFRHYADEMSQPDFVAAVEELERIATDRPRSPARRGSGGGATVGSSPTSSRPAAGA